MNTQQALENGRNGLLVERRNITEICETLQRLSKRSEARAQEVDEHARRIGDFIHNARMVAGEEPQQQAALAQARNDAKAALGPMFARDLWRELSYASETIETEMWAIEIDTYVAIVSWLFDRPTNEPVLVVKENVVLALATTRTILELFPALAEHLGIEATETTEKTEGEGA